MAQGQAAIDQAVRARLTLPPLREESLKIGPDGITRGRYLLTFSRRALLPGPKARFAGLARDLGLDATVLAPYVDVANAVHVGMEPETKTKLYLEFPPPQEPEPDLAFLAVKHDHRVNRYRRIGHLSQAAKVKMLNEILPDSPARRTAMECLQFGGHVLQVTEDGSSRHSIDIHLADARLTVGDLPGFDELLAGQDDDLQDIAHLNLGHFACGIGRDGAPFATLYFGGRHDP